MAKTGRPSSQAIIASAGAYSTFGANNTPFSIDAALEAGYAEDLGNGEVMVGLPAPITRNGVPAQTGMGAEAQALMADNLIAAQQFGYRNTPGTFFDPKNQPKTRLKDDPDRPSPILEAPTATSNPRRPRTVAAGYRLNTDEDGNLLNDGILTIIFRDGTVYNYYDVPPTIWNRFHTMHSKGLFIRNILDGYSFAPAKLTKLEREDLYQNFYVYRVNQQISGGIGNWRPKRQTRIPKASHGRNTASSQNKGRQSRRTK